MKRTENIEGKRQTLLRESKKGRGDKGKVEGVELAINETNPSVVW